MKPNTHILIENNATDITITLKSYPSAVRVQATAPDWPKVVYYTIKPHDSLLMSLLIRARLACNEFTSLLNESAAVTIIATDSAEGTDLYYVRNPNADNDVRWLIVSSGTVFPLDDPNFPNKETTEDLLIKLVNGEAVEIRDIGEDYKIGAVDRPAIPKDLWDDYFVNPDL